MQNPFKPGSGLYPPYFAGREREINIFRNKLQQTVSGTPMHMSVMGDWASGKTSLFKKFKEIAENENCFVYRIITPNTDSTAIFVNTISKSIANEIKLKKGLSFFKALKSKLTKVAGFQVTAFGFGASLQIKDRDLTPQVDLRVGLKTIGDELKEYKAMILLIDDFDTITENRMKRKQIMLTLRNGLMEAIDDGTKIMGVVAGAQLFEQFEVAHGPLIRFFEPYQIGLLEKEEAKKAILVPLEETKVKFTHDVIEKILDVTSCHPYYLQEFCYHLFGNAVDNKVDLTVFESSYDTILHDLAMKIWRQKVYELSDVGLKVFFLISAGYNTPKRIIREAEDLFQLKEGTIKSSISRMLSRGQIQKTTRGTYTAKDKLFGEYVKQLF